MLAPLKESYDKPRQCIKKQRHHFVNKSPYHQAMACPVVMYGCASWTIKKTECQRIDAFELWCWRRLLRVPWTARRSNQSILKEINPEYSLERQVGSPCSPKDSQEASPAPHFKGINSLSFSLLYGPTLTSIQGLPCWLHRKESACHAGATGDLCSITGSGRSPGGGHGSPLQYSCLKNYMDRGAWQATVHGVAKSQT